MPQDAARDAAGVVSDGIKPSRHPPVDASDSLMASNVTVPRHKSLRIRGADGRKLSSKGAADIDRMSNVPKPVGQDERLGGDITAAQEASHKRLSKTRSRPRPAKSTSSIIVDPAPCRHCRVVTNEFWCETCIRAHLERFGENMHRIMTARSAGKARVQALLGDTSTIDDSIDGKSSSALPDPFSEDGSIDPHPAASRRGRAIRALWQQHFTKTESRKSQQMKTEKEIDHLRDHLRRRRQGLLERRERLDHAWDILQGRDENSQVPAFCDSKSQLEKEILHLIHEHTSVQTRLARVRTLRQMQTLQLFAVQPPSDSNVHDMGLPQATVPMSKARGHVQSKGFPPSSSGDADLSQEWTILGPGNRIALPLPVASDIRRFPRKDINAAAAFTAQILQLNASTCGVALPFALGFDRDGRWALQADPLWTGSSLDTKHSLHLGKSAYDHMCTSAASSPPGGIVGAVGAGFTRSNIEQSVLSLGASTLATLESFVQLPGRGHQSWGRASVLQHGAEDDKASTKGQGLTAVDDSLGDEPPASSSSSEKTGRREDIEVVAARSFCRALIMLAFNASYLAWTQGVKINLVTAGGSTLRLLVEAAQSKSTEKKAHTTLFSPTETLQDFTFPTLEFSKLLQLHEPQATQNSPHNKSAKTSVRSETTSRSPGAGRLQNVPALPLAQSSSKGKGSGEKGETHTSMEESYVDAAQAAASIIDVKGHRKDDVSKPSTSSSKRDRGVVGSSTSLISSRRSGAPSGRQVVAPVPSKSEAFNARLDRTYRQKLPAPTNLDFLRRRGEKAAQEAGQSVVGDSSAPKEIPGLPNPIEQRRGAGGADVGGEVFFNGRAVGLPDSGRLKSSSEQVPPRSSSSRRSGRTSSSKKGAQMAGTVAEAQSGMHEESDEWDVV